MNNDNKINFLSIGKTIDSLFLPIFIITGIIYFTIFFIIIFNYDTSAPNRQELIKAQIKRSVKFVKKNKERELKNNKKQKDLSISERRSKSSESKSQEKNITTEEQKISQAEEQINDDARNSVAISAQKRAEIRQQRIAQRNQRRQERQATAQQRLITKMQKIQAKSRSLNSQNSASSVYQTYKSGSGGSTKNLAEKMARSGGVSTSGTGTTTGSIGRSGGSGNINISEGSIGDFLSSGDYGKVEKVNGIKNFKVTPLKLSSDNNTDISASDQTRISQEVNKRQPGLIKCIRRARSRYNKLKGSLVVELVVAKSGRIKSVEIIKSKWNNNRYGKLVEKCVISTIKRWRFPAIKSSQKDLKFTKAFNFS